MLQLFSIAISKRVLLLAIVDYAVIVSGLIAAAFVIAPLAPAILLFYEGALREILAAGVLFLFAFSLANLYTEVRVFSRVALAVTFAQVFGFIFLAHATLLYIGANLVLAPQLLLIGSALAAPLLFIWRVMYSGVLWTALPTDRLLFIGHPREMKTVLAQIHEQPALGISVLGYVGPAAATTPVLKHLGDIDAFEQILVGMKPTRIVVDGSDLRIPGLQACLFRVHLRRIPIERFGAFYERIVRRVCTSELRPSSVIFERELDAKPRSLALQSIYTNLIALVATILLLPFMVLVALWIRASSSAPALESRPRLGLNGVGFRLYQFRCHSKNGRLTRFGAWLQRFGFHKLPQFLNVLRGEMSLIGPPAVRPEFAAALAGFLPYEPQRRTVRPGILGWSTLYQPPAGQAFDELLRVEYDLYYIKHISLSLDLYILLAMLKRAFSGVGAAEATAAEAP
jgi:lipopolysaccharide/colanic/teichoic acid biosynthesis glycosyltransferase